MSDIKPRPFATFAEWFRAVKQAHDTGEVDPRLVPIEGATVTDWQIVGVKEGASVEEIDRAFKKRALLTHPDRGGDPEAFRQLVAARERLLAGAPTVHHQECPECRGSKKTRVTRGFSTIEMPCPRCQGQGEL